MTWVGMHSYFLALRKLGPEVLGSMDVANLPKNRRGAYSMSGVLRKGNAMHWYNR